MHKIDQAFLLGVTQNNSFDDGVRAARLTVEQDYGITIDRYAWVGLSGFAKVINTLGGVDIDVTHPVVDDAYPNDTGSGADPNDPYAYKRLYIIPGPQHLTGEQALEYVRSRHADLIGDIGRTQRQQQVLEALKLKLNLTTVLSDLPQLIKDMQGQVYTDFSEQEMIAFANFGRTLSSSAIQRITLGPGAGDQNYGELATLYDPGVGANQDVVIPHCDTIQPIINRIFDLGHAQSCNVTGNSR
jgi:LCP family protein required for cell wall assembly